MQQTAVVRLGTQIALTLIDANQVPEEIDRNYDPLNDYWVGIAPDWDLNVWFDEDANTYRATLYPVVTVNGIGHTVTDTFVPLDLNKPLFAGAKPNNRHG